MSFGLGFPNRTLHHVQWILFYKPRSRTRKVRETQIKAAGNNRAWRRLWESTVVWKHVTCREQETLDLKRLIRGMMFSGVRIQSSTDTIDDMGMVY